jgi:uncharacterized protein YdbL (DUF1318 family)
MARSCRQWVLLAYRLPREPSTPRITVWRKLRRLGVAQLLDGLVALPLDRRNREQFDWLADEIDQAGGMATIWTGELASAADERALVAEMTERAAAEYREIAERAEAGSRAVSQLRRDIRAIRARDHFGPRERELAERAVAALAAREGVLA